ncbi:MAG: SdrD B-like domain-containing protein [Candidatus Paceibacteria bacterium]
MRPNQGTQGSTLLNEASSATATPEITLDNNADDVSVDVAEARVDLATSQNDAPDPLQVGDTVVYTLTVRNNGPSVAEDVILYNVLPTSGLSFQGFQYIDGFGDTQPGLPLGVDCPTEPSIGDFGKTVDRVDVNAQYWTDGSWDPDLNNADIICNVADLLRVNQAVSFQLLLRAESRGVFPNFAISRSRENREGTADINPANDTEPENTTVRTTADMELVSKVAIPDTVSLFEPFEYEIVVRNNGPGEALGVELVDTLPAGMELTGNPIVNVSVGDFESVACIGAAGDTEFTCPFGGVSSLAQATVTLPVRLISFSESPVVNTATVEVNGLTLDPNPDNNIGDGPVNVLVSSLTGRVYQDLNLNGAFDDGEPGIAGVTLTLTGTDNFGNIVNRTTTTDANGIYRFDDLSPGNYTVTQTQPPGFVDGQETIGSAGGDNPVTDVISNVVLAAGSDADGYDFGEFLPASVAGISGFVYQDRNEDGVFSAGDAPIPGVVINLVGPVNRTTTSDADGFYSFSGLPPGEYTVSQVQPTGFIDGTDTPGTGAALVSQANDEFIVTLAGGSNAENWNFGELLVASVSGFVYNDVNRDGVFNAGDAPIPGVVINLSGPVNRTTTTDADGLYSFTDLPPGEYTIVQVQPENFNDGIDSPGTGAELVSQANDQFVLTLEQGSNAENWNFGELSQTGEGGLLFPYVRTGTGSFTFVTIIQDPSEAEFPTGAPPHDTRNHHLFYGYKPLDAAPTDACQHLDFSVSVTQGALLQFEVGQQFDLPAEFGDPAGYGEALANRNNRLPEGSHGFLIVEDSPGMSIRPNERRRGEAAIIDTSTGITVSYPAVRQDDTDPVSGLPLYGAMGSTEFVTSWYPRNEVVTTWYVLPLSQRTDMTPNAGGGLRASLHTVTNAANSGAFSRAEQYTSGSRRADLQCFAFVGIDDVLMAPFDSGGWMSLALTAQNEDYSNALAISDGLVPSGNQSFELWKFQHIRAFGQPMTTVNRAQQR